MANDELEKLRQKVEKDPLSRLFVPLAEEYRKIGMVEEAISVLLKGLENQPNYMTARVALGKIYLEKNMLKEAKEEFKKVISSIPDNLFALKKLAEISKELGEIQEAIDAYSKILKLNPLDEDAKSNLETLKQYIPEQPEPPASRPIEIPRPLQESPEPEPADLEGFMPETQTSYSEEEFEKFKNEFLSQAPVSEELHGADTTIFPEPEIPLEQNNLEEPVPELVEIEEDAFFIENPNEIIIEEPGSEEKVSPESPETFRSDSIDFSYIDRLIQEGNYLKAVEAYKGLLKEHPDDKRILQRFEELKVLLKILGKGNELLVEELNRFLQAIKQRKDEFLRNT